MEWSARHDMGLCTEIVIIEPYKFKKGSNERGKLWTEVANNLNKLEEVQFRVNQRGVRERWEVLRLRYLERMRNEERASGISPDATELDSLIEEILEKEKLAESSRSEGEMVKKNDQERKTAECMRKMAMETFGETQKPPEQGNNNINETKGGKRKRRSGSDALEYLRERSTVEIKLREEELALKRRQLELDETRQNSFITQQQATLNAFMQMQQNQTNAMLQVFERLLPKNH